jgi:sulfur carrier protein
VPPITERDVRLTVNGERRAVPADCTLRGLLQLLELEGHRVAVAVNRDVVPRSAFATRRLAPGDRIEILEAVGGG